MSRAFLSQSAFLFCFSGVTSILCFTGNVQYYEYHGNNRMNAENINRKSLMHNPHRRVSSLFELASELKNPTTDDETDNSTQEVKDPPKKIKAQQSAEAKTQRKSGRFVPEYLRQNDADMKGIGGQGGVVYDVNKVKRNLVQEAVRAYKTELLYLLATPSLELLLAEQKEAEDKDRNTDLLPSTTAFLQSEKQSTLEMVIEEKLAALVRNNPVSTTTDSNLLEGSWEIAYIAPDATSVLSWKPSMFSDRSVGRASDIDQSPRKQDGLNGSGKSMSPFQSISRTYHLENLNDDETAYVVDCKRRLGQFFMVSDRTYEVTRLTRTSLELTLRRSTRRIFSSLFQIEREWDAIEKGGNRTPNGFDGSLSSMEGGGVVLGSRTKKKLSNSENVQEPRVLNVQILYLDSDLCVCVESSNLSSRNRTSDGKEKDAYQGKLVVYTKSQIWTGRNERFNRTRRMLAALPNFLQSFRSPYNIRGRVVSFVRRLYGGSETRAQKGLFFYHKRSDTSSVRVLRLGESEDEDEELSWEGDEDPFVELDAVTRQEKMKLLSIAEIKEAARAHKRLRKKNQQGRNKRKQLKRPPRTSSK